MGVGGQRHALATFIPGKDPVPIVQEAGWAPGPVYIGGENIAPPGFYPRTVQPVGSHYANWATRPCFDVHFIKGTWLASYRIYEVSLQLSLIISQFFYVLIWNQ